MYREILAEDGLLCEVATDRGGALTQMDRDRWFALLLDQKLQGAAGPDSGLDLIEEARQRCPGAQVLVVTGYATTSSVERAFAAGAYDVLEKTQALPALLRIKLRGLEALHRAQQRRAAGVRDELRPLWREALACRDRGRRGKLLEDVVAALFRSVPELGTVVRTNARSAVDEFDMVIRNDAVEAPWNHEKAYLLVECKHWTEKVDRRELDAFLGEIGRLHGRCSAGFFVAPGGFTAAFLESLQRGDPKALVIPLDRGEFEALIDADDRRAALGRLHERASLAAAQ